MKYVLKLAAVVVAVLYLAFTLTDIKAVDDKKREAENYRPITAPAKLNKGETKKTSTVRMTAKASGVKRTRAEDIYCYIFEPEEEEMLIKLAMAEAEGEDIIGKALVIRTVINRRESEDFPDTIEEIITQKSQFSSVTDDGRYYEAVGNEDCKQALKMVEHGWDESQEALYFESCTEECWQSKNREFLFRHGGHNFYR